MDHTDNDRRPTALHPLSASRQSNRRIWAALIKPSLACFLIFIAAQAVQAQRLPDPNLKTPPNIPSDLPSPSVARSMAERARLGVDSLTGTIQRNGALIERLNNQINDCNNKIDALTTEMKEVLEDYRHGYFCNECGRSKREFYNDQAFWAHIAENAANGRRAVPASQEKLAAKEKEYKDKIAALERDRATLIKAKNEKQEENRLAWDQIQQGVYLWQTATALELNLMTAHEENTKRKEEAAIKQAEQNLAKIESERRRLMNEGPLEKETQDQLNEARSIWQEVKNKAQEDADRRISSYWNDLKQARETEIREYTQLSEFLQRTEEYKRSRNTLPGYLPTFDFSFDRVTKDPMLSKLSIRVSPDQLGAKFKFGSIVSSGITAGVTDATSTEIQTFIELFERVKFYGGWRNTTNPYDFSGPTGGVSVSPPKDKPRLPDAKVEEKPKIILPKP